MIGAELARRFGIARYASDNGPDVVRSSHLIPDFLHARPGCRVDVYPVSVEETECGMMTLKFNSRTWAEQKAAPLGR
jgi:hypothetical protein